MFGWFRLVDRRNARIVFVARDWLFTGWIGCSKRMPDVSTNGRGMRWGARRRIEGAESRLVLGRCDDGVVGGSDRRLAG